MNWRKTGDLSWSAWFLSPWPILYKHMINATNHVKQLTDWAKVDNCSDRNIRRDAYWGKLMAKTDPFLLNQHLKHSKLKCYIGPIVSSVAFVVEHPTWCENRPGTLSGCGSGCPAAAWPGRWAGPFDPSRRCSEPPPSFRWKLCRPLVSPPTAPAALAKERKGKETPEQQSFT